jgi:pimeloyl-ACP methyl ester carboxylesterase
VLVVWASEDRVMPPEHGGHLAQLFPDSRLVEIPDSYTLVPEDQPAALASQSAAIHRRDRGVTRGEGRTALCKWRHRPGQVWI